LLGPWAHACGNLAIQNYRKFISYWDEKVTLVSSRLSDIPSALRPTVLILYESFPSAMPSLPTGRYFVMGGAMLANDLIRQCGAVSPLRAGFATEPGEQLVSFHRITQWDPDVLIIAGSTSTISREKGWRSLKAVRDRKVYAFPRFFHIWGVSNPEMILHFLWIAKTLYPERFEDLNLVTEVRFFYRNYFRCDLSEKHVQSMLQPTWE
jgi:iron complex transport system substrate-binding protein